MGLKLTKGVFKAAMLSIVLNIPVLEGVCQSPCDTNTPYASMEFSGLDLAVVKSCGIVKSSNKIFISFILWSEKVEDCVVLIERQGLDGRFRSVGAKMVYKTKMDLYYSWVDEKPESSETRYRVRKIANSIISNE